MKNYPEELDVKKRTRNVFFAFRVTCSLQICVCSLYDWMNACQ